MVATSEEPIWGAPSGSLYSKVLGSPSSAPTSGSQSEAPYLEANLARPIWKPIWGAPSESQSWASIWVPHLGSNLGRPIWEPFWGAPPESQSGASHLAAILGIQFDVPHLGCQSGESNLGNQSESQFGAPQQGAQYRSQSFFLKLNNQNYFRF